MKKALEKSNLVEINQYNLLNALDSEGNKLPPYSNHPAWSWYGDEKVRRNPLNGRHYDLRNTGRLWSGIRVKVTIADIFFTQKHNDIYIQNYEKNNYLGISKEQFYEVQMKNKPILREQLEKIISNV